MIDIWRLFHKEKKKKKVASGIAEEQKLPTCFLTFANGLKAPETMLRPQTPSRRLQTLVPPAPSFFICPASEPELSPLVSSCD